MRLIALLVGLGLVAGAAALWASGGLAALSAWAVEMQREAQNAMAGRLSALRAGEGAAFWALTGLAAAYGFVHALGPGHGKVLLGGAAFAGRVPLGRMLALSLAAGLGQAATAIVLTYGALILLETAARPLVGLAEGVLAPASYVLIGAVGLWMVWRGLGGLSRPKAHAHGPGCGHAHGPDPAEVAALSDWRGALALVASIAIRPCTGAILLLFIAWRLDLILTGIAAAVAMGLGTAAFNATVASGAVLTRESLIRGGGAVAWIVPGLQVAAGAMVALLALALVMGALRL